MKPSTGTTDSFIGLGPVNTQEEAESLLKYIKTKLLRAFLELPLF